VKREQLLSRLRRYCRKSGLAFESSAKRGKGSHITVRVGDRTTTVKAGELSPGYVGLLLRQLDLPPDALR
jgi:mRNA interferase HicA